MSKFCQDSVSLFFAAGDFGEAWRRHEAGEQQAYATHNEVMELIKGFDTDRIKCTVYSFVTATKKMEVIGRQSRIVSLGANNWSQTDLLLETLKNDNSTALIPHFPNLRFIDACKRSDRAIMVGMATSYNRHGFRARWEKRRVAKTLSDPKISLVTNHCMPSTQKLAEYGIPKEKLVPWDIPHTHSPSAYRSKTLVRPHELTIAYAGSIAASKGVVDLISAIAILNAGGLSIGAICAGAGQIAEMEAYASSLNLAEKVRFLGLIGNDDVVNLFRDADLV
ncbi:MAG TPA: glycosyltransferase, partial [Pirellula sp.]|nr:glycosyltransferase [Pirellula sp.]